MKQLILASIASNIIHAVEFVFPNGFRGSRLAVVSTAAHGESGDTSWLDNELNVFREIGFTMVELNLEGAHADALRKSCEHIDALLVTGGNTYYLLHHVRKSGFDTVVKELVERGVVYIGSSAGALLAGPSIDVARRFDDPAAAPELSDYGGLELVNFATVSHTNQKEHQERFALTIDEWKQKPYALFGLTDTQAIVVTDNFMRFVDVSARP